MFRSPEKIAEREGKRLAELSRLEAQVYNSKWKYYEQIDEMTGAKRLIGRLVSDNIITLNFPYNGGSRLSIAVCRHPREVRVAIDRGQFIYTVESGLIEPRFVSRINFRIGDGRLFVMAGHQPKSMATDEIVLDNPSLLTMRMRNMDSMLVEPQIYNETQKVFRFNPLGMSGNLY
jgi:hypothetical protein